MPVALETATPAKKGSRRRKLWIRIALAFPCLFVALGVALLALNWPFKQEAIIDILQERTVRSVTIGRFHVTYFPPGCVAEQISFLHRKHKDKPPLITIQKLVVAGSYWGLLSPHKHLTQVRVYGLHVTVPPSDPNGKPNPVMPLTQSDSSPRVVIGSVVADGTVLDFIQRDATKPPIRLKIQNLLLDNVGNNLPLRYRARLINPNPPGIIESSGEFGTWNTDYPAETPVHGTYCFTHANLSVYSLLAGTLQATGSFEGPLRSIHVKGSLDVPDFQLKDTAHKRDLQAQFDATVGATDGNIDLNHLDARFDRTELAVSGSFTGVPSKPGKAVSLDIKSTAARMEDLLRLVISSDHAPMLGAAVLEAKLILPPDAQSFLREMQVDGTVQVTSAQFTSPDLQQDLAKISNSASKKEGAPQQSPERLRSNLASHVSIRNGVAQLSRLQLVFPGNRATLDGPYRLADYSCDLHGTLETDGSPSAATPGFKAFVLKGLTPFLKKREGHRIIPFKIQGNYHNPKVDLDLGHKQPNPAN